jgi:hypothetical protein
LNASAWGTVVAVASDAGDAMTSTKPGVALVVLFFCLMACGGGHGGPTAPADFHVKIGTALWDTTSTPTILEAKLFFDGKLVCDAFTGAGPLRNIDLFTQGTAQMTGQHTLSVAIAAQTVSPTRYLVLPPEISFFDASDNRVNDIRLEQRQVTLATGQSTDYTVVF